MKVDARAGGGDRKGTHKLDTWFSFCEEFISVGVKFMELIGSSACILVPWLDFCKSWKIQCCSQTYDITRISAL